jgi:hypothetical protein
MAPDRNCLLRHRAAAAAFDPGPIDETNAPSRRLQRNITRVLARFGAITVRTLFLVIGLLLVADALLHHRDLW